MVRSPIELTQSNDDWGDRNNYCFRDDRGYHYSVYYDKNTHQWQVFWEGQGRQRCNRGGGKYFDDAEAMLKHYQAARPYLKTIIEMNLRAITTNNR